MKQKAQKPITDKTLFSKIRHNINLNKKLFVKFIRENISSLDSVDKKMKEKVIKSIHKISLTFSATRSGN